MSTTANQVFEWVMAIADELSPTGTVNPSDTNDYKFRTPAILNSLQSELIKPGDIYSTHEVSHKPATTIVGLFDVLEYEGVELTREGAGQAKAYYLEADGEGTIYVEDYTGTWNTLATITVPNTVTDFTAYSGVLTPTSGSTATRFRFTGTYRYLVKNFALFSAPFQLARIPIYRPYFKATMPTDFKSVDQIVNEEADQYNISATYKWEGKNELYIPWEFAGNIRIVYRPVPSLVSAITDTLQVDDVTARTLMVYGLGMELYKDENADLYNHFLSKYEKLKSQAMKAPPATEQTIVNVYGGI
jgi:hypothetical protein